MRRCWPGFERERMVGGVRYAGTLRPTAASPEYAVHLEMPDVRAPVVWVRDPEVREDAPHRWSDGSLCLYKQALRPWGGRDLVALTVVPWAAVWLGFYEAWIETGIWWGPEAPHDGPVARGGG